MARRVFLSFVEEDLTLVHLFRGQAKSDRNDLEFHDYSVKVPFNSDSADYIRRQIRPLINGVSVVLCLIGHSTRFSSWVNWELEVGRELGKGLLGVRLHSDFARDLPPNILSASRAEIVNWNIREITTAIERAARAAGY